MTTFNIGILDDNAAKVTQIMTKLSEGVRDADTGKTAEYHEYTLRPVEITIRESIEALIEEIINKEIDCMIIDYKLNSNEIINYNGIKVANLLYDTLYDFPIFILTSYEDDLFSNETYDAYKIFNFGRYLSEKMERIELNFKIIEQVRKYKKQLLLWEQELLKLLPHKGKSVEIDSQIIELDTKIEKSINGKSTLSKKEKIDFSNKLDKIISRLDNLIREGNYEQDKK